jgi:hypothetical protein
VTCSHWRCWLTICSNQKQNCRWSLSRMPPTRCACFGLQCLASSLKATASSQVRHGPLLQEWLRVSSGVRCHWLPQPPARIWGDADGPANRSASIRTALLQCCTAMCHAHGWACRRCFLCNLFSLEGGAAARLCHMPFSMTSCTGLHACSHVLDRAKAVATA